MSYDLYVCTPPLPASDREAWKQCEELSQAVGEKPDVFHAMIAKLAERYPWDVPEEQFEEIVWSFWPLYECVGSRLTQLCMIYSKAAEVAPFVIETAHGLGLDVFEPQLEWIFRHDGIAGSVITVENRPPFRAPTLAQILETVDALTPNGGPGFLVLADERDDYTQAAGGPDGLTVEWREYSGETFRHWVAGTPDAPALADIEIRTNGHVLMVKENEKLSSQQVKEILTAYVKREPRPNNFAWREITDKFLES